MGAATESTTIEPLIADLLSWIAKEERSYAEVMDAWRTSCPRLPVWEEANARGLVAREVRDGTAMVTVTAKGRTFIDRRSVSA
ncbi:MAG: hypothetical protein JO261_15915 [Alphaproteobacteria bacterium]|nr:hypothetical protein [Alphaproteobacteria bacterium]MBV9695180.1 hypothetical protein [Alphaproteobacteria bacterium]